MYKLVKTIILGSDVTGNIGVNTNYRSTMGYDDTSKTISVKVEKLVKEDLTRDETTTTNITYQVVAEREFTVSDFMRQGDHNSWCVDFDVTTETITEPLNVLVWGDEQRAKNPTLRFNDLRAALTARYSVDLLPLFILKSLDNIDSFDHSLLTFLVPKHTETSTLYDTIITNTDVEEMTYERRSEWFNSELTPHIQIEVLDLENNVVATPTKTNNHVSAARDNNYAVTLPVADSYKLRYTFDKPHFADTPNTYTVTVVNGNVNKNRIVIGAGTEDIILSSAHLTSGDFTKVKLNIGLFQSFSELWITYE